MCVIKLHAFIYFLRPPPWSGTTIPSIILLYVLCTVYCLLYIVHCILFSVHVLYTVKCTLYSVDCIPHTAYCTLHIVYYILYNDAAYRYCTLYIILDTKYTVPSTLYWYCTPLHIYITEYPWPGWTRQLCSIPAASPDFQEWVHLSDTGRRYTPLSPPHFHKAADGICNGIPI